MTGKKDFDPTEDFEALINLEQPNAFEDKTSEQVSILTRNYESERNDRNEERFIWILVLLIIVDFEFFTIMQNIVGPIVIGCIETLLIFVLAERCGIDGVLPLIDRVLSAVGPSKIK